MRALTQTSAVTKLLNDVGSRHKLKNTCVQIIRIKAVAKKDVVNKQVQAVLEDGFKVPVLNKTHIPLHRALRKSVSKQ